MKQKMLLGILQVVDHGNHSERKDIKLYWKWNIAYSYAQIYQQVYYYASHHGGRTVSHSSRLKTISRIHFLILSASKLRRFLRLFLSSCLKRLIKSILFVDVVQKRLNHIGFMLQRDK